MTNRGPLTNGLGFIGRKRLKKVALRTKESLFSSRYATQYTNKRPQIKIENNKKDSSKKNATEVGRHQSQETNEHEQRSSSTRYLIYYTRKNVNTKWKVRPEDFQPTWAAAVRREANDGGNILRSPSPSLAATDHPHLRLLQQSRKTAPYKRDKKYRG